MKSYAYELDLMWRRKYARLLVATKMIGWQDEQTKEYDAHLARFRELLDIPEPTVVRLMNEMSGGSASS